MQKELKKSHKNKVIGGVCGGIGEYFDIDPVFVRLIVVLLALGTGGVGFFAYIIAMIIMPSDEVEYRMNEQGERVPIEDAPKEYSSWNRYLPGFILIGIGIVWLVHENFYWIDFDEIWPLILILGGLFLIFRRKKSDETSHVSEINVHVNNSKQENGGSAI